MTWSFPLVLQEIHSPLLSCKLIIHEVLSLKPSSITLLRIFLHDTYVYSVYLCAAVGLSLKRERGGRQTVKIPIFRNPNANQQKLFIFLMMTTRRIRINPSLCPRPKMAKMVQFNQKVSNQTD